MQNNRFLSANLVNIESYTTPYRGNLMITFKIFGELGNQMFQWATGITFAKKNKTEINFEVHPNTLLRITEFKTFDDYKSTQLLKSKKRESLIKYVMKKFSGIDSINFSEKYMMLNYKNLDFKNNAVFDGYFQSWRYFDSIRREILNGFELKEPSPTFKELLQSLPENFTSIHIRRGATGAAVLNSSFHGLLDLEYYKNAITLNEKLGGSRNYVIFTDNPDMAAKTVNSLNLIEFKVIGPKDIISQCENLHLMSKATSFIGANSSYSWWAAYLNSNLLTQPIFPRQWYMDPDISNNDMLLPDWLTVGFKKFLNENMIRGVDFDK